MDNADDDVFRHVSSVLGTSEARLYDQVNSSFSWVLGTLFTSNGGALVALLSRAVDAPHSSAWPLGFFAAGVICSILLGIANAAYATKTLLPTTDLRMTLALLGAGEATLDELKVKMAALDNFKGLKSALYGSGLLSLGFLISGMFAFAFSI